MRGCEISLQARSSTVSMRKEILFPHVQHRKEPSCRRCVGPSGAIKAADGQNGAPETVWRERETSSHFNLA